MKAIGVILTIVFIFHVKMKMIFMQLYEDYTVTLGGGVSLGSGMGGCAESAEGHVWITETRPILLYDYNIMKYRIDNPFFYDGNN